MAGSKEIPKFKPLPRTFYEPSAKEVAAQLLGHWLIRNSSEGFSGGLIVETEAYLCDDPACHGAPGLTRRNRTMFGPPGFAYVYLIYGCHSCINAVCDKPGSAEAVLIRAIEPLWGIKQMMALRKTESTRSLTNGPGKLCAAMGIDKQMDGADLCDARAEIFIASNPERASILRNAGPVLVTTRIGISKAADLPLRFVLAGSKFVSKPVKILPVQPRARHR